MGYDRKQSTQLYSIFAENDIGTSTFDEKVPKMSKNNSSNFVENNDYSKRLKKFHFCRKQNILI